MVWTPGHRRTPPGISKRQVGEHMRIYASIANVVVRLFTSFKHDVESDIEDDTPIESGDTLILQIERGKMKIFINLSEFTTEELEALRGTLNGALDTAAPIVAERDKIAKEAIERGDNPYYRSLRPAPTVSFFAGRARRDP